MNPTGRPVTDPLVRFEKLHAMSASGCDEWTGHCEPRGGYGVFSIVRGKHMFASRAAWILHFGPLRKDQCVCHRCDNPKCVRLDHLFLGTHAENMADMKAKGRWTPRIPNRGVKVNTAKLTEAGVRRMRKLREAGWTYARLAAKFGIKISTVQKTCVRTYWKHVA